MEPDRLSNEVLPFGGILLIRHSSNGAQFIYSLLYLMMIHNITLVSQVCTELLSSRILVKKRQERDWGKLEYGRKCLRTIIVGGESFVQDYLLQLLKKIFFPTISYSVLTHWMFGEALQTQEAVWLEAADSRHVEHSRYNVGLPT